MGLGITTDMVIEAKAGEYFKKLDQVANEPDEEEPEESEEPTDNPVKKKSKKNREEQKKKRQEQKEKRKEEAKKYKEKLKEKIGAQVQILIDTLDAKFAALVSAVEGIAAGATSLVLAFSAPPDGQAPNSSKAVKDNALGTAKALDGQLKSVNNGITEVEGGVTGLLGELGPAETPISNLKKTIGKIKLPV